MIEVAIAVFVGCCVIAAVINTTMNGLIASVDRHYAKTADNLVDISVAARRWTAAAERSAMSDDALLAQLLAAKKEKDHELAAASLRRMRSDQDRTLRSFES